MHPSFSMFRTAVFFPLALGLPLSLGACGGDSTGVETPRVAGATYTLESVAGAEVPARFEPCDDPEGIFNARITSGFIRFGTDGRATAEQQCIGEEDVTHLITFNGPYRQEGERVLIETYGDDAPPDTGIVSGNTLTVRAQFGRESTRERYVVPMVYMRR